MTSCLLGRSSKRGGEMEYREPWHTILKYWTWLLPGILVLGVIVALLWLLYSWSIIAGIVGSVILAWVLGLLIFAGLATAGDDS